RQGTPPTCPAQTAAGRSRKRNPIRRMPGQPYRRSPEGASTAADRRSRILRPALSHGIAVSARVQSLLPSDERAGRGTTALLVAGVRPRSAGGAAKCERGGTEGRSMFREGPALAA